MIKYYHNQPCDCTVCFHQKRAVEMAQKEFLKFLQSKDIKELVLRADIECCHAQYRPLQRKIEELKQSLSNSQDGSTRKDEQELSKTNSFLFRHPDSRKGKKEVKA